MTEAQIDSDCTDFERETRIRDAYAANLDRERPHERLLRREHTYGDVAMRSIRGDMKTVDHTNALHIWEFKIQAGYSGLGQILAYVAMARKAVGFEKIVRGVLAAFSFQPEITEAMELLNLGIEAVEIPPKYRQAGGILPTGMVAAPPVIPAKTTETKD
jgi:RecB family endonuclease NucS